MNLREDRASNGGLSISPHEIRHSQTYSPLDWYSHKLEMRISVLDLESGFVGKLGLRPAKISSGQNLSGSRLNSRFPRSQMQKDAKQKFQEVTLIENVRTGHNMSQVVRRSLPQIRS